MVDIVTAEQRSRNMAAIRSRDTKPEVYLRKLLFSKGYRYRIADKQFRDIPTYFCVSTIRQFLCMAVSGTDIRIANMRTRPNPELSSGRRNSMIMSDGTKSFRTNCRQETSNA